MSKNLQFVSIIFLGLCILLGSRVVSQSFDNGGKVSPSLEVEYRYDFNSANEQNVIIFDKKMGNYWREFIESNEGPTDWEKQESPVTTAD